MSEFLPLQPGPDGRFGYARLALYWSEPATRWAFLIRCDEKVAGFALVTRGSPGSDDPEALDVAEFFVLRRHRRSGIGREAAVALWITPGHWSSASPKRTAQASRSERRDPRLHGRSLPRARGRKPHDRRVFTFHCRIQSPRLWNLI
jgi:predicted acetyltransferase